MKAREIKKMMLDRYDEEVCFYQQAKEDVARREANIRLMQDDLKMYFNVVKSYNFGLGEEPLSGIERLNVSL